MCLDYSIWCSLFSLSLSLCLLNQHHQCLAFEFAFARFTYNIGHSKWGRQRDTIYNMPIGLVACCLSRTIYSTFLKRKYIVHSPLCDHIFRCDRGAMGFCTRFAACRPTGKHTSDDIFAMCRVLTRFVSNCWLNGKTQGIKWEVRHFKAVLMLYNTTLFNMLHGLLSMYISSCSFSAEEDSALKNVFYSDCLE